MQITLGLSLLAPLGAMAAVGDGGTISSKLQVHMPPTLSKTGGYEHREALFGVPPYGGSLQQNIYYADSELCEQNVNARTGYPIRPLNDEGKMEKWPSPFILMVDRGGCTFVQKVRNAQHAGAAGVIIADNTCLCSFGETCHSDPGVDCETLEPIMADDGSGADITIPSFLMFKQDADPIKAQVMANHMVMVEMAWALPNPDDRVEYEFWSTPTDMVSKDFQKQFKDAAKALGNKAYFTPHMYIYDGLKSGCQGSDGENQCYNLCTNNGRYCATDPDNDLDQGISGADVVAESIRRACIWQVYGKEDGVGVEWWDYVNEFVFRCDNESYFNSKQCADDCMVHAEIDQAKIETCVQDSGGLNDDVANVIFDAELAAKDKAGVVILPATFVNGAAIRGALEFQVMFKAICSGYVAGSEPDICTKCASCPNEYACVKKGSCHSNISDGSVSTSVFGASLLGLAAFFGIIGVIQWRRSQMQVRAQVKGILAEYMPLDKQNEAGLNDHATDFAYDSDDAAMS